MAPLENRPKTALLVVDVQNGVVAEAHQRDEVVANVGSLVDKARRERIPVVWVQHSDEELVKGSDGWPIVPELSRADAEPAWGAPPPAQVIAHTNLYWKFQTAPGRTAGTVETKDVDFRES